MKEPVLVCMWLLSGFMLLYAWSAPAQTMPQWGEPEEEESAPLGYDRNGNGIWDDIEKAVFNFHASRPQLNKLIVDLFIAYQDTLKATTPEEALMYWETVEKRRMCIFHYFTRAAERKTNHAMEIADALVYGSTERRVKAFLVYSELLDGQELKPQHCTAGQL